MGRDPFYDSPEWQVLRYRVLKESKGCCECCGGRASPGRPIHVDHIKPRSKHPELALVRSNLQVLCKQCNLGKGARDDTDWRWVTSVDPAELVAAFDLTPAEREARKTLLDRSITGSTRDEREAARRMLDEIKKYAHASFMRKLEGQG